MTRGLSMRLVLVTLAGTFRERICGTCSWRARSPFPPWLLCIICNATLTSCGRSGRLYYSGRSLSTLGPCGRTKWGRAAEFQDRCKFQMQISAFMMMLQAPASNPIASFLPLIAIVAIFYFLVFIPMQKQKKAQAQILSELQAGAEILTTGVIIGTIVSIAGDMLILRVKPDNIKLQVSRASVASLVKQESSIEEKK